MLHWYHISYLDMGFVVWKPSEDDRVIPNIPSARLLSLGTFGDFVIPVLKERNDKGERQLLVSFLNRDISAMDYYTSLANSISTMPTMSTLPFSMMSITPNGSNNCQENTEISTDERVGEVLFDELSDMYDSDCDNRPQETNATLSNTITAQTWSSLVAELITEIESIGLGICQPVNGTVVTIQNQKKRGAAMLLHPLEDGGSFQ